ncbi:MAG: hypothetical protein BBJ60_11660 [Desulfobacterales bacterium S7086C20]|nr:MAG: hypothetical protein BBJ60_11660 [Desulfobacterales bacterium S7086C20]
MSFDFSPIENVSRDRSMEIPAPKDVGSGDHLGKGGGCEYIPQSTLVIDQGYVIPAISPPEPVFCIFV